jgi:hypothetical protein
MPTPSDIFTRAGGAEGKNLKALWQTDGSIRSFTVSQGGARIICLEIPLDSAAPGRTEPHLVLLRADGSIIRKIDLAPLNLRVFGAPQFVDQQHIGLTVCAVPAAAPANAAAPARPAQPPARTAQLAPGEFERMASQNTVARQQWAVGQFPSQPFIATIDLEGHNLKRLGPGAMPCWSPDGKTILYTEVHLDEQAAPSVAAALAAGTAAAGGAPPATQPSSRFRLMLMDADGHNPRPLGPDQSCDGSFSPDGARIAYVAKIAERTSQLFLFDVDGSNARSITSGAPSLYGSPRWIGGNRLEFVGFSPAEKDRNHFGTQLNCIWSMPIDGGAEAARVQLSPPPSPVAQAYNVIDADAETWIFHRAFGSNYPTLNGPPAPIPPRLTNQPQIPGIPDGLGPPKQIPAGYTVESVGTRVYFRDANGNRTPIPDGDYILPNGRLMHVRGGGQNSQN